MISVEEANAVLAFRDPFQKDNGKIDDRTLLDVSRMLRASISASTRLPSSLVYYSRLRPSSHVARLPGVRPIGDRWLYAETPIDPSSVVDLDLLPTRLSLGHFLFDVSESTGIPIEMTQVAMVDEGFNAAALFVNPSRRWQMSYFTHGIGPVGHMESNDPIELLVDLIYVGKYRFWNPGIIDSI